MNRKTQAAITLDERNVVDWYADGGITATKHLDNKTCEQNGDDDRIDADGIEELLMAKIRRSYIIHGRKVWLAGNTEQEMAEQFASIAYPQMASNPPKTQHKFRDYAEDNWRYIEQTVSVETAMDYRRYLDKHLLPHFGDMYIEDIDMRCIQAFYDNHRNYSRSTVHKWKIVLLRLMKIAVADHLIPTNPVKDSRLKHSQHRKERPVPTPQEYKRIVSEIPSLSEQHERLFAALLVYTGLRKGEILALRWHDIDFEHGVMAVTQNVLVDGASSRKPARIKPPKSDAGIRQVPIVPPLKNMLEADMHINEFIVYDIQNNRPIHTNARYNTMWRSIRQQINMGEFTAHSFRHFMGTTLITEGVDLKTAQVIMGHSQPSTTLNIYTHVVPGKVQEAGIIFSDAIAN